MLDDHFTICIEDGEEVECTLLFVHQDEKTGKEYVVYTEDDEDDDENMSLYSARLETDEKGEQTIKALETEEEEEMMDAAIEAFFEELERYIGDEE